MRWAHGPPDPGQYLKLHAVGVEDQAARSSCRHLPAAIGGRGSGAAALPARCAGARGLLHGCPRAVWCAHRHRPVDLPARRAVYDQVLRTGMHPEMSGHRRCCCMLPGMHTSDVRQRLAFADQARAARTYARPIYGCPEGAGCPMGLSSDFTWGHSLCLNKHLGALAPCLVVLGRNAGPEGLQLRQRGKVHLQLQVAMQLSVLSWKDIDN